MTENHEKSREVWAVVSEEKISKQDRDDRFSDVTKKSKQAALFSECTEHIRHSGITASMSADIAAELFGWYDYSRIDAAEEISRGNRECYRKQQHKPIAEILCSYLETLTKNAEQSSLNDFRKHFAPFQKYAVCKVLSS